MKDKKAVSIAYGALLFLLFSFSSYSEDISNTVITWKKAYGGSYDDGATSVQQTKDGGYIVAGKTWSCDKDGESNYGGYDCWILKLDNKGKDK